MEGLPGVTSVTSGFSNGKEINTVSYDAGEVTVAAMVAVLKDAGTYLGTAKE
ncbi:MAG: hypothetical protein QNK29_00625 [Desulfobacterales bacterium]|nr:hypothetical protein [Desulfobacterales bacterium]MDX2510530.1 hypothetical protein [Desulfobacterales bacterium]